MKSKEVKQVLPMNLQFFGGGKVKDDKPADVETGNQGADDSDGADDADGADAGDNVDNSSSGKTFTQAEVTAMMAKEKKEGRKSMLKQLGFKNEAEAKQAIDLYTALVDSQKTQEQRQKEQAAGLADDKDEAEKRAEAAENKLACVLAGVKKDSIDDALAIAKLKVTNEKNLDQVLAEMKQEARYSGFFGADDESDSTGSSLSHKQEHGKGKEKGSYGSKLAKVGKPESKKSSYFN